MAITQDSSDPDKLRGLTEEPFYLCIYCHNRLHLHGVEMSEEQKWHGRQGLWVCSVNVNFVLYRLHSHSSSRGVQTMAPSYRSRRLWSFPRWWQQTFIFHLLYVHICGSIFVCEWRPIYRVRRAAVNSFFFSHLTCAFWAGPTFILLSGARHIC